MSELIHKNDNRATIRWKLLTGASALVLAAATSMPAQAADGDRPVIWFELGGQMENIGGQSQAFAPPFLAENPDSSVLWQGVTPLEAQRPPKFAFGESGKISFQPEDSDWVFSAAVRIGRSNNARDVHHQTNGTHEVLKSGVPFTAFQKPYVSENFVETQSHFHETHTILDFSAGRDVGLGLFGTDTTSVLSAGVRFAQFGSNAAFDIRARPDLAPKYAYLGPFKVPLLHFHAYHGTGNAVRDFRGVGPSLSWTGSAPFAGNAQDGELMFDWGANAAILFGRQKARVQHMETGGYHSPLAHQVNQDRYISVYQNTPPPRDASRNVTVPNLGGSIGLSWRVQDFKVSMGYRADFFFGAMDTGIDARKSETLDFKGPYASISVGFP